MSEQPFGDIPLFREIHRLLSSGGGPINLEIARQVALAVATQGSQDPDPRPDLGRAFGESVREAELLAAGYSRRLFEEPVRAKVIGRAVWVTETLGAWAWLFEHLAERFTAQMSGLGADEGEGAGALGPAIGQIGPLLLGVQVGSLIGNLSSEALGRYSFSIPRDDDGLFFVAPNVDQIAIDYGFKTEPFARWLAIHDVARHLLFETVPWLKSYLRSQLLEVVDAIDIDVEDLQRRLVEMQTKGMEALGDDPKATSLPIAPTERHRRALDRLRAVLAVFEGHAGHIAGAVLPTLLDGSARIDEGMARRRLSPSEGEQMLAAILGIALDRDLETAGATFCKAIIELQGPGALDLVWSAPDNLPVTAELKDPFTWMDRVLEA